MVSFKEDGVIKWNGPAKVIGIDGKTLHLKYGNNVRRVHQSKVVKEGFEFEQMKNESNQEEGFTGQRNENNINSPRKVDDDEL